MLPRSTRAPGGERRSGCPSTGSSDLEQTQIESLPRRLDNMASKLMYSLCAVSVQMLCCPLLYKVAFPSHAVFIVTTKIRVTIKCFPLSACYVP